MVQWARPFYVYERRSRTPEAQQMTHPQSLYTQQQPDAGPVLKTLTGVMERITYQNEETGYTVARLLPEHRRGNEASSNRDDGNLVTVVGNMVGVAPGEALELTGLWKSHPQHGWQFAVENYRSVLPATEQGIRKYLGSGLIKGVGPKTAEKIVGHFGVDTLGVLEGAPDRLGEVPRLGPHKAGLIATAWVQQKAIKEVMLFLQGHGISTSLAVRIYKEYGDGATTVVKNDPYRLARDVWGIGFKTADKIAQALGFALDDPKRLQAGTLYVLSEASDSGGHTYLPRPELAAKAAELLGARPEQVEDAIQTLLSDGGLRGETLIEEDGEFVFAPFAPPSRSEPESQRILREEGAGYGDTGSTPTLTALPGEQAVYLPPFHSAERGVASSLRRLKEAPPTYDRLAELKTINYDRMFEYLAERDKLDLTDRQQEGVVMALRQPVGVLTGGPGTGKALALDTPIPTPDGWTIMDNLRVGDHVYDEYGRPCKVVLATEVMRGHPCYEVMFDDGSALVADADHLWLTDTLASRKSARRSRGDRPLRVRGTDQGHKRALPAVVTTAEIAHTLRVGKEGRLNHSIRICAPIEGSDEGLSVDPYVLGVWLGNGHSQDGRFTTADQCIVEEIQRCRYQIVRHKVPEDKCPTYGVVRPDGTPLRPQLRELGVLGDKHVPLRYLRVASHHRLALLQGIMDTDGYAAERDGRCEVTVTSAHLADGIYELVTGLGIKARRSNRPVSLNGKDCGTAYRVSFVTDQPVFRLPRKLARLKGKVRSTAHRRYITHVRPVPSVPVRCIQVDSPSHLYLAGRSFIPTHNTTSMRALIRVLTLKKKRVVLAAPTGRAAKRLAEATGLEAKTLHRLLQLRPGAKAQYDLENPIPADVVIVDETSMLDTLLMNNLLKGIATGAHLLLVGDADQLPSVGAGNVLADVIASGMAPVVKLDHIFRQGQGSAIVTNAHRINGGQMPVTGREITDFYFFPEDDPERAGDLVVDLVAHRIPARFGYRTSDIQVLSPVHGGKCGVGYLNEKLQEKLNPSTPNKLQKQYGGKLFRAGDKVLQLRNNYDKDVYNGDSGLITSISPEDQEMTVRLEDGREVSYDYGELDELTLAYALSIHKSQGSEYPVCVIPVAMGHYMLLERKLIYTAVTRARQLVVLVGSRRALAIAVNNGPKSTSIRDRGGRYTGLAVRLAQ